jgi:hypothetical protein
MTNLILIVLIIICTYNLIIYLNKKYKESAKNKVIALIYSRLKEYKILSFDEVINIKGTPLDIDRIEVNFTPGANLFSNRFYYKVQIEKESEIITKWIYAFYFMNFQISYQII